MFRSSTIAIPHAASIVPVDRHTTTHTHTEHALRPFDYELAHLIWSFNHPFQVAPALVFALKAYEPNSFPTEIRVSTCS
jgi:hypothetical protein